MYLQRNNRNQAIQLPWTGGIGKIEITVSKYNSTTNFDFLIYKHISNFTAKQPNRRSASEDRTRRRTHANSGNESARVVGQRNNVRNEMQSDDSGNFSLETYTLSNRKLPIALGGIERGSMYWQ